jgi:uroporphyrinogen III methyltransferase/synthase
LQGKVYLVGAGPGDPELITLKGCQMIGRANVILHDHLIPLELFKLARPDAEIISVGKFGGSHTMPQDEINHLLIEKAKNNKVVVRLKGGDPFLFGRGGEEAEACSEAGVDFEVVPAVTSALAAPSYAGIPPTHRDYTSNVAIVTGHRKKDDLQIEIPRAGTVIFLMGVSNMEKIIDSLLNQGWPEKTKMAAIENGTRYNQRVIKGTIENFPEVAKKAKLQPPAIFIIGKVVEMQEKLNWFAKKPNILVLGGHPDKYSRLGNIVHRQIIDCVPIDDHSGADAVLKNISAFDWIVFTSVNGAKYLFERLFAIGRDARALCNVKIATIGRTTAKRLAEFGISADMVPKNESSAGLLAEFANLDMKNTRVLLPQSNIATKELGDGLLKLGTDIEKLIVYKTVEIDPGDIDFDYIDRILFTSGSMVRAFINRFGPVPPRIKSYCLGPPTLTEAKKLGFEAELVPD